MPNHGETAPIGASAPIPDRALRDRLIASHLPLVKSIARRYVGQGEELDDLVQVGAVGLVKAGDRFDPGRGVAFATFAGPVIEGEIRHHLRDRTSAVRIPRELERVRSELRRRRAELASTLGRHPTVEELAAALGVEEADIERALTAERARDSVSITAEAEATDMPADAGELTHSDDRLLLASSLRSLGERERRIVFLRFHADMTENEIAREIGISQAHVSRLLSGALGKLRDDLDRSGNRTTDGDTTFDTAPDGPDEGARTRISGVGESENLTLAQYLALPYHFDVRAEREGEQSSWTASVEELPNCVARADTPEDAIARLRPAMESWLTSAIAEHREIPLPGGEAPKSRSNRSYSGRFLVRMPKSLHEQLALAAEQEQTSFNRLVTDMLTAAVARGDLGKPPTTTEAHRAESGSAAPSKRASPRSIRIVLATNLVVVVVAGILAVVLLVLALERGV